MNSGDKKIGVFDSGFGGLTILKAITQQLPEYDYVYLGDTARTPYGTRSQNIVYQFTKQAIDHLIAQECVLIILACNTASAEALRRLQGEYVGRVKILGVIIPAAEHVASCEAQRVGVLATESTIASGAFEREIHKLSPEKQVLSQAAPLLVPFVENHESGEALKIVLKKYLQPLIDADVQEILLGCTHYGLIKDRIAEIVGSDVCVVEEGPVVAEELGKYLQDHDEISCVLSRNSSVVFHTTDLSRKFQVFIDQFFGPAKDIEVIELE